MSLNTSLSRSHQSPHQLPSLLFTCEQSRAIDAAAISEANILGIVLMKRAARASFEVLQSKWAGAKRVVVFCGGGNNGGDGYILAALAAQKKLESIAVSVKDTSTLKGDAKRAFEYAQQESVTIVESAEFTFPESADDLVIVDAVLGTGFHGELDSALKSLFHDIQNFGAPILSLDIPSGLSGDTGRATLGAIEADATVTFIAMKQGLLTGASPRHCGELIYLDLDVPAELIERFHKGYSRVSRVNHLTKRKGDAHKGDHGHVMVVGGDLGFGGAAMLAAEAAMGAGAGLVSLVTRAEHVSAALSRLPEVMAVGVQGGVELEPYVERASVIIVGPGLGLSAWSQQLLLACLASGKPAVLDADALNLLSGNDAFNTINKNCVITPHLGEASRLLSCKLAKVQADRFAAVERLSEKFSCTAVLKGAGTLIHSGNTQVLANVGNPAMAVAGMGDVLSGIIGALMSQGLNADEAAITGVCAHGFAGDCVAAHGEVGVRASAIIPHVSTYLSSSQHWS